MLFRLGETAKSQPREQDHHDDNADGGPDVNQCPWHDERPLTVRRLFRALYMSRHRHRISYVQDLNASFAIPWILDHAHDSSVRTEEERHGQKRGRPRWL